METRNQLFNSSFKTGLIIAAVGIVVFMFYYIAGIQFVGLLKPFLLMAIGLAINIVILVYALKKFRTNTGGYISFLNAFLYGFIALVCAGIISSLFNYLFIHYFDPEYMKNMLQAQRDWMENYMTGKASDEQVADALAKIDRQAENVGTIMTTLKGIAGNILIGAIIALIVGAIMQKKVDVFENKGGTV